jgi:D-alanyl-D-alanine dipeptidase/carboxypeptidase
MSTLSLPESHIHTGCLILVNREHPFTGNEKEALVLVQESCSSVQLQRRAAVLLANLMEEIQGWESIVPISGWRSFREQQEIWDDTLRESGLEFTEKYVAIPGHSEHQTGLAIDLGLKQENIDFICPDFPYSGICQIFRAKASEHGFIERYPAGKEHITGIGHEPWHFRYVGVPHAEIMSRNDLTLEEYIDFIKQFPYGREAYGIRFGGQDIAVSYLKTAGAGSTSLEIDSSIPYSISGNNLDGFIMTEWRQSNEFKTELRGA